MSSPQINSHDQNEALENESALDAEAQDPERVGLLGYTDRMLDRRPTSIELRLGILAFWFLCLASIGFGLFAGEQAKFHEFEPSPPPSTPTITTTVFLSPTKSPSPPRQSGSICYSGPCVDVAGDLRRIIQWDNNPCDDFAKFSAARTRKAASDIISAEIDHVIDGAFSAKNHSPILQKLLAFKSMCSKKINNTSYSEFHPILRQVSTLFLRNKSHSKADRFGAVLVYLHSASLAAFFKTRATNYHFTLQPQKISIEGIEDAFTSLYPADEVLQRISGVKILVSTLSTLADNSQGIKSVTIDELQDLTCSQPWVPCWIHWKDFYAALDPGKVLQLLHVQGKNYFSQLGRVILEQTDIILESYFHWITIITISNKNCQEEMKFNFGSSLLQNLFLKSQAQLLDWNSKTKSAQFFLQSLLDLSPNSGLPQKIETPSIDENQEEELSSISSDNWVDTAFNLARIKTRKEFSRGQAYWNSMGTELKIVGNVLYFPLGALQPPLLYLSISDLPKSLMFGSLGFNLFVELTKSQNSTFSNFENTCQLSLAKAFHIWKQYKGKHPEEMKIKLVGLLDEVNNPDQLFYLAFGRLGLVCPGIERGQDFMNAFNCSSLQ